MDEYARWLPRKYGGIQSVKASFYDLWYPKITSFDSGTNYKFLDESDRIRFEEALIAYNGSVRVRSVGTFYGPCTFDPSDWPFDQWNCLFTLCKPTDDDGSVVVNFDPRRNINTDGLVMNNIWQIISEPYFQDSSDDAHVELKIILQKHRTHYRAVFAVPGIVLLILSLLSFWLTKTYARMLVNLITTLTQLAFIEELFTLLEENGTKGVTLFDFYLDTLILSIVAILFAVVTEKFMSRMDDPPHIATELIGVLVEIPYLGLVLSWIINESDSSNSTDDDEVGLVGVMKPKFNNKWKIICNFWDRVTSLFVLLYFIVHYLI